MKNLQICLCGLCASPTLSIPSFLCPTPISNFSLLRQLGIPFLSFSLLIVRGGTKESLYLAAGLSACSHSLYSNRSPEIATSVEISD